MRRNTLNTYVTKHVLEEEFATVKELITNSRRGRVIYRAASWVAELHVNAYSLENIRLEPGSQVKIIAYKETILLVTPV